MYHEKLIIPSWKTNIALMGESKENTIISYNDYSGKLLPAKEYFLKIDTLRLLHLIHIDRWQ